MIFHLNPFVDVWRNKRLKRLLFPGHPEIKDGFHKTDGPVAAFNMDLFPQKMDEYVFPMGDLIYSRGYVPEFPFGTDIIEIDRKEICQLLDKVINRFDFAVQELGNIPGKQISVLDENTAKGKMDDQV